jgi:hypothetical protein
MNKKIILFLCFLFFLYFFFFVSNNDKGHLIQKAEKAEKIEYKKEFYKWKKKCEILYELCGQGLPLRIETSIKITKKNINTHRYSIFLQTIPPKHIHTILSFMNVPHKLRPIIFPKLSKGNVIYGADLSCNGGRLYFNETEQIKKTEKKEVIAYEWANQETFIKYYFLITPEHMLLYCQKIPSKVMTHFLEMLPVSHWEDVCVKYDSRESIDSDPCSFYFSSKYSPTLKQIYPIFMKIMKTIGDYDVEKWYENYKDSTISWYVLSMKKNNFEFSVYFNTNGRIWDYLESKMYDLLV